MLRNPVADGDDPAAEDIRTEAAAMDERPKQTRSHNAFEVGARLREPSADALDRADVESLADEGIE